MIDDISGNGTDRCAAGALARLADLRVRQGRFVGAAQLLEGLDAHVEWPDLSRFGPGWALVGDAGYDKDPLTAQGISDAFRDAELCSSALESFLAGRSSFDDAMSRYQHVRDSQSLPMYDFTTQLATLEPPPVEMQQLLGAMHGKVEGMDSFVSVIAGTLSPLDFFAPDHIGQIMLASATT